MSLATDTNSHAARSAPPRPDATGLILAVVDDPRAGVAELAEAVGTDPLLTARVMTLANSAYYGLSGRVGRLSLAVSVLGFNTVRAVTLVHAADLGAGVPDGFWDQCAFAATAANLLAPVFGAEAPDAFVVGLLHTFGAAMLHQTSPLPALCLPQPDDADELLRVERALYGTDHADVAASLARQWRFPAHLCELIAEHHLEPLPDADPLTHTLHAARVCTHILLTGQTPPVRLLNAIERSSAGRIRGGDLQDWTARVAVRAQSLGAGLSGA